MAAWLRVHAAPIWSLEFSPQDPCKRERGSTKLCSDPQTCDVARTHVHSHENGHTMLIKWKTKQDG